MNGSEVVSHAQELIRSGKKLEARNLLTQLLKADPRNVPAWLWLVETLDTDDMRLQALQQCVRLNPEHPAAQKALTLFEARITPKQESPEPAIEERLSESLPTAEEEITPFVKGSEGSALSDQQEGSTPFSQDAVDDILGEWRALPDFDDEAPLAESAEVEDSPAPDLSIASPDALDEASMPGSGRPGLEPEPEREWAPLKEEPQPVIERVPARPGVVPARPAPVLAKTPKANPRLKLPGWLIALIIIVDLALLSIMIWLIITSMG